MAKSALDVLGELKKGSYAPVYFLHGEEEFFIDLISDHIEEHAIDEASKGFNQVILYGKDTEVREVLTQAKRFPMMSERQTVIVKEAQGLKDLNNESAQQMFEEYLKQPLNSTILVLCHKHKAFDKRKKFFKVLEKNAVVVESKKLYENQVPDWTKNFVKERGHAIDDKAAYMLAEYLGANLQRLSNEIEKVLLNFKEPTTITPQMVQKYVGINKDYNSFELQRAIALKQVLKANQIVKYFGENPKGNPVLPVIAVLYSFFTKLLLLHQAQDKSERSLASELRVSPYFVKEYVTAARNYSLPMVIRNIGYLRNADLSIKGVTTLNLSESQLLKELIFKLMH